jgi:hypothetical protein
MSQAKDEIGIEFFQLEPREEQLLKDFTEEFAELQVEDVFGLLSQSTDKLTRAKGFITENPRLVSKIIHRLNNNPDVLEKMDPRIYEQFKKQFPISNPDYYIPPIAIGDPMDPVAVLPAALAVAVVAAAIMFVGRGGLRGVV